MSDDLVKRLNDAAVTTSGFSINNGCPDCGHDANLFGEAAALIQSQAARIERLEAGLQDVLGRYQVTHCHSAARAALKEQDT